MSAAFTRVTFFALNEPLKNVSGYRAEKAVVWRVVVVGPCLKQAAVFWIHTLVLTRIAHTMARHMIDFQCFQWFSLISKAFLCHLEAGGWDLWVWAWVCRPPCHGQAQGAAIGAQVPV